MNDHLAFFSKSTGDEHGLDHIQVTEEQIERAVSSLSGTSAPGPDGMPGLLLKKCISALIGHLKTLINDSLTLKTAAIVPIHKGGNKKIPSNYRPVSLTPHMGSC